jgi:hypothetical protein
MIFIGAFFFYLVGKVVFIARNVFIGKGYYKIRGKESNENIYSCEE